MSKTATPSCLVAAGMRNEGPFIVEWVAWYRMLGFEVLVVTNDCTDHSVALLETLAAAGWIYHRGHLPPEDEPPKRSAHRAIRDHPATARADWLLICDVDEFLVLHRDASIQAYLARFDPPPLGIAFHWKCFGTGGEKRWKDRPTHRSFFAASATDALANRQFKSMFRRPRDFAVYGPHAPRDYCGPWETDNHVWVDCRGKRLNNFHPNENPQKGTHESRIRHDLAQMNHYILRSAESFELKRGTPSPVANANRYTEDFFRRFDCNETVDDSALRFAEAFDRIHGEALAIPDVKRLHFLCCADYATRLAERAGRDPGSDRRVQRFLDRAGH